MGSPNAVSDILNNPRFQGSIQSIKWLTQIVDSQFTMFISFIGFFIISVSILRNVIAGAYASFPKFFDMVAEAKEAGIAKVQGQRMGGIAMFLLRLVPDFKSISDFHDNTIEPRHYFMKAVPKSIAAIMIGAFIYNGFYRDTVAVAANFGSTLISRALLSVDPVVWFDKLTNMASDPVWATDGDNSLKGTTVNGISKDIYNSIVSFYTDVDSQSAKSSLAQAIEPYVSNQLTQYATYLGNGDYDVQYQVDRVMGSPDISAINNQTIGDVTTEAFSKAISDFKIDSNQHKNENWYDRIVVRFTKKAQGVANTSALSNVVLTVPQNSIVFNQSGSVEIPIPAPINGCSLTVIGSTTKAGDYLISISGSTLTLQNAPQSVIGTTLPVNGSLFYQTSDGKTTQIGSLVLSGPGSGSYSDYSFSDPSGTSTNFSWGQSPQGKTQ